ncbi:hypothetical protein SERLADRAFT_452413 [Serpula lacrymans var. lacrymans S7.9]|uniref:Helicase ATP-binding domain-containing protein n=1 Tax=Serpula lacrymans var. lacrymans (strain S7.9) TaxID=578457 RepID=F8P765_SERL9|nr:uncharacterized protein SERLADRAFT_452413 [Serpula lacrymans var. lacrymans S7.9]EGO21281.1 hypothetical protein SERLADRAFT_452413 [Serpula lacrymans var. lacrymans S7.9]
MPSWTHLGSKRSAGDNSDTLDPYALPNLLAAGTVSLDASLGRLHEYATRRHSLQGFTTLPVLHPEKTILNSIEFLIEHRFIRATGRLGTGGQFLFVRIYLIPHDLPNVQGKLRNRSDIIKREGKKCLQTLLDRIVQDQGNWDGDECVPSCSTDNRNMAEIYSDLQSPHLPTQNISELSRRILNGKEIWGLTSRLYNYQRRSVAMMIDKETYSAAIPDPTFITVVGMHGEKFFLQPATLEILRECPMVSPCSGGILCEELGTGKTVMILALILATLEQLPKPEESLLDSRPIMTPLAFRSFPFQEFSTSRKRMGIGHTYATSTQRGVPSLVEILLHHIRTSSESLKLREYQEDLEVRCLWDPMWANFPFYHHYDIESPFLLRSRRRMPKARPRLMYLTTATLLIVPPSLLGQWEREILKHCNIELRCLVVRRSSKLPDAKDLASNYDLVIMTTTRLKRESSKENNLENLHSLGSCLCSELPGTRIPDCRCKGHDSVSPLLRVRWKRLVVDEGHIAGNSFSAFMHFIGKISVQRRWIVTGTPTTNILGLSLGRTDSEGEDHHNVNEALTGETSSSSSTSSDVSDLGVTHHTSKHRIWGAYERDNLRKLHSMIRTFLAVPQFYSVSSLFDDTVIAPLLGAHGPLPGAITVLSQVMQSVMVRHQVEDVEKDVVLPPMKHEIIYMDLDPYAVKSYNALQASIAINAIDSQRTDQDYLFHAGNAKHLQNALDNMSQCMFWSASDILYNVDENCNESGQYVATAVKRNVSESDMRLLSEALTHMRLAAEDPLWRAMQVHEDVPFRTLGMDSEIFEAWTRSNLNLRPRECDLMHAIRLIDLRDVIRKRPLIKKSRLLEEGVLLNEEATNSCQPNKPNTDKDTTSSTQMKRMVREVKIEIEHLKRKAEEETDDESADDHSENTFAQVLQMQEAAKCRMMASSVLAGVRVGRSTSTKLNYILDEVLLHSPNEKFLIFSASPLTLAHVAEGLSLVEVKYLRYTTDVLPSLREQLVMTFETSDTFRVFLMDLKHAARGLNLVSASRVIFCEPVWMPDVESQAIKRAHRIGQTRPISVKTLVIRSTAEEAMIGRRQAFRGSTEKIPGVTTDKGMRDFIAQPRFLYQAATPGSVEFPLLKLPSSAKSGGDNNEDPAISIMAVDPPNNDVTETKGTNGIDEAPRKKKRVQFFDLPS